MTDLEKYGAAESYTKERLLPQVVIDIETMADEGVIEWLPEPSINGSLKDPEKIKEAKRVAKIKQIDKMALSPLTGKVACIGFYGAVNDIKFGSEKEILDYTYKVMAANQIVSYNGKGFDIPFIFKRGIILGLEWATIPNMKKYTDRYKSLEAHIDIMTEFCNYGEYEKLDTLGRCLLGETKVDFNFRDIPELIKTEEGRASVAEYCLQDCALTWKLGQKMGLVRK